MGSRSDETIIGELSEALGSLVSQSHESTDEGDNSQIAALALELFNEWRFARDVEAIERTDKPSDTDKVHLKAAADQLRRAAERLEGLGHFGIIAARPIARQLKLSIHLSTGPALQAGLTWTEGIRAEMLEPHLMLAEHLSEISKALKEAGRSVQAGLPPPLEGLSDSERTTRRGAPKKTTAHLVCEKACEVFEALSGRPAPRTMSNGRHVGPFAVFLASVYRILEVDSDVDRPIRRG